MDPENDRSMVEMTQSPTHSQDNNTMLTTPGDHYSDMTELEQQTHHDASSSSALRFHETGSGSSPDSEHKGASELITTINTICNVIGGGVLSLPSGFAYSSLIVGIFLLVLNASLTFMNLYFIIMVSEHLRIYDYGVVLRRGLGQRGAIAALVALTIFPGGALIAYARVIADAMPPVLIDFFGASGFIVTPSCWILIGGVVFFALSCRRTLSELFISSIFGIVTIMFAILCVVIRFFDGSYSDSLKPASVEPGFRPFYVDIDLFRTIPLIIFSLSVHNNAPHYYQELRDRTPEKMMWVFGKAHVVIVASYMIMAIFGLLTFGESHISKAKGNILDAYSEHDVLLNVARLVMFIHFVAVYPILQMATRKGLNNLIFGPRWLPMRTLVLETACIVVVTCFLAFVAPNIDDVLAINGSVCGSIVILIIPSILYLRVVGSTQQGWTKYKILAAFSIVYGIMVLILGLTTSIMTMVDRKNSNNNNNNTNATNNNSSINNDTSTTNLAQMEMAEEESSFLSSNYAARKNSENIMKGFGFVPAP